MHHKDTPIFRWQSLLTYGVICGICLLYLCLVGIFEAFQVRDVIDKVLPLGLSLLLTVSFIMGYVTPRNLVGKQNIPLAIGSGVVVGLMGGAILAIFISLIEPWHIRTMFVNASPKLIQFLTFKQTTLTNGLLMLIGALTLFSTLGAITFTLPSLPQRTVLAGLTAVLFMGMLQDFLTRINIIEALAHFIYGRKGLTSTGAVIIFVLFAGLYAFWSTQGDTVKNSLARLPKTQRQGLNGAVMLAGIVLLIAIPHWTDSYVTQIMFLVGLYTAMGLGLNLELGWAGLLDLGFAGFFAIGAYTVAIMTSTGKLGLGYSFWVAVPTAVLFSAIAGVMLGIPVLRTRGDYLAIITLGLAEIIRIMVKSNAMKEVLGGAQGVLNIAKPNVGQLGNSIFGVTQLKDPMHFYYLILLVCAIIGFISWRLQHARIGRNWIALREDEDVAEAMGINLIATKLLAFGIGASFAGFGGAIFAAQLGSVFPDSFGLLVSVNVVSLVIIGGLGSIPGVIIGALVLVGLPELLREFAEFRLLIYGVLLIVMMLVKPEGFWPSEANLRQLHNEDETDFEEVPQTA